MKKFLLGMLAIVGLLFVTSCSSDDSSGFEESTLSIQKNEVKFTKDSGKKSIAVTTDATKWSAIGSADWIKATRNGNQLEITVSENTSIKAREGKVLIVAGTSSADVLVKQEGAKGSASINLENIEITQYDGNLTIDVIANDVNWTATTDADWLTLTPKTQKYELDIAYKENTERTDRTAKIIITIGNTNKEITVKQSGILFYLLPYLDFRGNARDIKEFEFARRSDMVDRTPDASDWIFNTRSPYLWRTRYFMKDASGNSFQEAHTYARGVAEFKKELPGLITFLKENGFKPEEGKDNIYHNEEKSVSAEFRIIEDQNIAAVVYVYIPKQDKAYPTFKKFPDMPELVWGATNEDIKAYEASHDGTLNTEQSKIDPTQMYDFLLYSVNSNANEVPFMRMYMTGHDNMGGVMFKDGLIIKDAFYKNTELAYYKAITGYYYMTKEFLKLAKDNGYGEPIQGTNDYTDFINTTNNTTMKVKVKDDTLEIIFMRTDGIAKQGSVTNGLANMK